MKKTTINHRWMKFRLRTLLVFVALLAASFALGPTLWQRHQRNHAIESAVSGDPDQIDSYSLLRSIADNSGRDHRDLDLVLEKLLQIVETGPDGERTKTAVIMIRELAERSGSVEVRERYLGDLIHELTNGSHAWSTEEQIVRTIAHWTPSTGLNQQQRLALLEKAQAVSPEQRPDWVRLLDSIGGREETLVMLDWGESRNPRLIGALRYSGLVTSTWPGLIPYLERWLSEPSVAAYAMEFSALSHTGDGRRVLLEYALEGSNPIALRREAIERLKLTVIGIEMMLDACAEEPRRTALSQAIGDDAQARLTAALAQAQQYNGDELWNELIDGLDASYSITSRTPNEWTEYRERMEQYAANNLESLRLISGESRPATQAEWRGWYNRTKPGVVSQRRIVVLVLEHPELLNNSTILHRVVPYRLGYIPDDCAPFYKAMLHSENPSMQYWGCQALLMFSNKIDAVPVDIELIGQSPRSENPMRTSGAIHVLQKRFAVNFFWDIPAWNSWWEDQRAERQ